MTHVQDGRLHVNNLQVPSGNIVKAFPVCCEAATAVTLLLFDTSGKLHLRRELLGDETSDESPGAKRWGLVKEIECDDIKVNHIEDAVTFKGSFYFLETDIQPDQVVC